ncbi:MAG: zinc-binding dehydrogenase [Chloroflexota bacterium]|nr:zinc-binding dehydrogenase [Chloroflexota bacterium]
MTETCKRAVFVGPKQIRFDELPIPEPGPRQALVKVRACALCTWEQRMYTGDEHYYPLAGGHEVAGELVKLGSQVFTDAQVGDRVMASPLTRCGYCESCRHGLDNICDNNRKPFRETDIPGPAGLAEYILLDDYQLYKANHDTPFEEICLTEPLACVLRSVRKARVERADNVVIAGAGIMGLFHLMLAKQIGARVVVSEPHPERAAFARKMGADVIIDPTQEPFADQVKALTGGRGADVIFCAVSVAEAVGQAVEAVAKGGRVHVYASIHPRGTKISIDPNPFHSKEIVLTGTMSQNKEDVHQTVRMISRGLVDLKPFISLVLPFEKLEQGLQAALRPDTYRVIVTM